MFNYLYDHKKEVVANIPTVLRKSRNNAFLRALVHPLTVLYAELMIYQANTLRAVKLNSQQMIFANHLNELYDPSLKRINVYTPDPFLLRVDAYYPNEGPRLDAYYPGEGDRVDAYHPDDAGEYDFIVEIPTEISGFETEIETTIEKYKLPTKTYNIVEV